MKSVQFFFPSRWIYRLNFAHLRICYKPVPKAELLISSPVAVLTAISILTQTWVISDLPCPGHSSCQTHLDGSCLSAPEVALTSLWHEQGDVTTFLPLPPIHGLPDSSAKVTQVRVTTACMWGSHKPCWHCSMLGSHKTCRWYTQMSLQVIWHEPSLVCAPGYQKHLLSFNKPWNSFIDQR